MALEYAQEPSQSLVACREESLSGLEKCFSTIEASMLFTLTHRADLVPIISALIGEYLRRLSELHKNILDDVSSDSAERKYSSILNQYVSRFLYLTTGITEIDHASGLAQWEHLLQEKIAKDSCGGPEPQEGTRSSTLSMCDMLTTILLCFVLPGKVLQLSYLLNC